MRTLLAIVIFLGGIFALNPTADARKSKRIANPSYYSAAPSGISPREVCEQRAFAEDPTGRYAGYPCWARETFGRGSSGIRGQ